MDADAHLQARPSAIGGLRAVAGDGLADRKRGQKRTPHVILMRDRRPEQREEPVAGELRCRALVALHFGERGIDKPANQVVHRLGPEALGKGGRPHEVAKQHADPLQLPRRDLGFAVGHWVERRRTAAAEIISGRVFCIAAPAENWQRHTALAAEPHASGVFGVALRARHAVPPQGSRRLRSEHRADKASFLDIEGSSNR